MAESPLERGDVGESSSSSATPKEKPVIVRVKRKAFQSLLEAFWLEICERPLKRTLIDFQKLSISGNSNPGKEELIQRVLVQHVQTVSSSEAAIRAVQSFLQPAFDNDTNARDRPNTLKKNDSKQYRLLAKAKQEQQALAKNARFEQIWSRRGKNDVIKDEGLGKACRLYDIVRVDAAECLTEYKEPEMPVEDQKSLSAFLPLLREYIPSAAEEIEADICSYVSEHGTADVLPKGDDYVYDLYAVKEDVDETVACHSYALVQVNDDDDFYDGPDDSDYDTDDSNAENHPFNEYPEEESEGEQEGSEAHGTESEEHRSGSGSEESSVADYDSEDRDLFGLSKDPLDEEDMSYDEDEDEYDDEHGMDHKS